MPCMGFVNGVDGSDTKSESCHTCSLRSFTHPPQKLVVMASRPMSRARLASQAAVRACPERSEGMPARQRASRPQHISAALGHFQCSWAPVSRQASRAAPVWTPRLGAAYNDAKAVRLRSAKEWNLAHKR
jgi:hypothetical protein